MKTKKNRTKKKKKTKKKKTSLASIPAMTCHNCLLCFRAVTTPQWWMLRPTYYIPSVSRAPLYQTLPALLPCCDNATKPLRHW